MKRWIFFGLVGLLWNPMAQAADAYYINNGTVTFPPQIDAVNFINNGIFSVDTEITPLFTTQPSPPFQTSNTRNYTNYGSMFGTPGFQFDNGVAGDGGARQWSDNFVNRGDGQNNGVIQSTDPSAFIIIGGPNIAPVQPSYLLISATNVVNQGLLSVGANGLLEINGGNINLSRSGVEVAPIVANGSANFFDIGLFIPDVAVSDLGWDQTNLTFRTDRIWDGRVASAPGFGTLQFPVSDSFTNRFEGITVTVTNLDTNGMAYQTNINVPTNMFRQAAFVGVHQVETNLEVRFRFSASSNPTNEYQTIAVGITVTNLATNLVTAFPDTATIYFVDTLASETNRGLLANAVTVTTSRPANYLLSRTTPFEYFVGRAGYGTPAANFFYSPSFTNTTAAGEFADYGAFINNVVSQPPAVPGGSVSNTPGRVQINADVLNLNKTRIRGEGDIIIQANHLIGSTNAVVDCENLSFNLGSTNGNLHVLNLAKQTVTRLKGNVFAWSGLWTNTLNIVLTNYNIDTNTMTTNRMDITNAATVMFHTLLIDATSLATIQPVSVSDFVTHSANVLFSDPMTVSQTFSMDAQSLTLNGSITLSGSLSDWTKANAPNLRFLTNNGTLNIPNEAHFGDDRSFPYSTFVNRGTNNANGFTIYSSYFENAGINSANPGTISAGAGGFMLRTPTGKIENGLINSFGDIQLFANDLKMDHSIISTSSRLDLTVTNSLSDAGGGSANLISCRGGFQLLTRPKFADLIGTEIRTTAPRFSEVDHFWAGLDLGVGKAGFSNNVAIGKLKLYPEGVDQLFVFGGARVGNGLYVDYLDLSLLTDLPNQLQVNPNLVIYYAAAKLSFAPPNLPSGVAQLPEEYLDGQFGGHLRWVREFAGPNSSVDVLINGSTAQVNRALRNSKIIDSDGDGVPNYYDFTPFDGPALIVTAALVQASNPASIAVQISWEAAPATAYSVQTSSSARGADWQTFTRVTNNSPANKIITILDSNISANGGQRFYRVGYGP